MKTAKVVIVLLAVIAALGFVAYNRMLPTTWKPPVLSAEVPSSATLGDEIPVTVSVKAGHSNIVIREIRFVTEGYFSSAVIPGNLMYPIILYRDKELEEAIAKEKKLNKGKDEESAVADLPKVFKSISRETKPTETKMTFNVPLGQQYYEAKIGEGTLKGRIDVILDYPVVTSAWEQGSYPAVRETLSHSFQIEMYTR